MKERQKKKKKPTKIKTIQKEKEKLIDGEGWRTPN